MKFPWLIVLLGLAGCDSAQWNGISSVYVLNATDATAQVEGRGTTPFTVTVAPGQGQLFEGIVAGSYFLSAYPSTVFKPRKVSLVRNHSYIMNLGSAGCMARADVSGMYQRGHQPVRVLQKYAEADWVDIVDAINVMPGHPLPSQRPKDLLIFQRLAAYPCELGDDPDGLRAFLKNLR